MIDDGRDSLEQWQRSLATALGLDESPVDLDAILGLAGVAAHAVVRPAAPLTTLVVGYAAGRAVAGGTPAAAAQSAIKAALEFCPRFGAEQ